MKHYDHDGVYLGLIIRADGWVFAEDRLGTMNGHESEEAAMDWLRTQRRAQEAA